MNEELQRKMQKHTPGQHVAVKGLDGEPDRWGVFVEGMFHGEPCQYHMATIENGAPGDTLETEEANALLFAHAAELLAENMELMKLFELQRSRVGEATIQWRHAHNKPDVSPDLGELVGWLLGEKSRAQAALDEVLKEAVWIAEALKLRVEMDWAETFASEIEEEAVQQAAKRDPAYKRARAFLNKYRTRQAEENER